MQHFGLICASAVTICNYDVNVNLGNVEGHTLYQALNIVKIEAISISSQHQDTVPVIDTVTLNNFASTSKLLPDGNKFLIRIQGNQEFLERTGYHASVAAIDPTGRQLDLVNCLLNGDFVSANQLFITTNDLRI